MKRKSFRAMILLNRKKENTRIEECNVLEPKYGAPDYYKAFVDPRKDITH